MLMPAWFSSIKNKLRLMVAISLLGLLIIGINSKATRTTVNNFSKQTRAITDHKEILRSIKTLLMESSLILDEILYENKGHLIARLLALNENTLSMFETFKSEVDNKASEYDYFFTIENEPVILQIRNDFYRCISLYKKGKKDDAIKYKIDILHKRLQHIDTFIANSEELQRIKFKELQLEQATYSKKMQWFEFCVYIAVALIAIFILFLGETISRAIIKLTNSVSTMAHSNEFKQLFLVESNDEIGKLAETFNHLIAERNKAQKSLLNLNKQLEQRIEERTTELRKAQQDALRKERLATLGQVTATVSHELRNPLGTIRTSLYSLRTKYQGKEMGVDKVIARIERSVDRCNRIVSELLDFSRVKELQLESTTIDIWLQDLLAEYSVPEEVTLKCEFASKMKIDIDRDRFWRVIINILDNAVQAITSDVDLDTQIHDKIIILKTQVSDDWFIVSVIDTGSGMSADIIEKIFEPLFSTKNFGVGLGLPMVQNIMRQHSGKITINSQEGEGTQVNLKLPLSRTEIA